MAQSDVLELKENCNGCGTTTDLYGTTCKHMTVCIPCGKSLAETGGTCTECGAPVGRLIREFTVKHHVVNKNFFVGRFHQDVPHYSKKYSSEAKWSMQREGLQGRQLTDAMKEKYKNKPWMLEDDIGHQQFSGQLEGGQSATYFLLIMQGSDFLAMPAGNWYNFHKVAQYKQLTLEEAEEQMKNRRKTADGYQRWMMKAANNGAAAFSIGGEIDQGGGASGLGSGPRVKREDEDGPGSDSDKAEEDADEEEARKNRLGMNKGPAGEEDEESPALELDLDDDDGEKGDDWEHEENFTDDDEGVANDADERDDQVNPEVPPPPEIKQEEEDEDEEQEGRETQQEEPDGLSKSGKELKKLIRKAAKEDDSDGADDDDGTDEDVDLDKEDIGMSLVLAPTRKEGPKEEPPEVPAKAAPAAKSTPPSANTSKPKRKANAAEESKANGTASKKAKSESAKTAQTTSMKKDMIAAVKAATAATTAKPSQPKTAPPSNQGVTEDEIMRVLRQSGPIKSTDLVAKFKSRLKTPADKAAFAAILKKISRIQKTDDTNYIVLRA